MKKKSLFSCKVLALVMLFCVLFQTFCITAFAEPYTVTSSKGNLTFTLDEDWENRCICVNGMWWYFDYSKDCTYIWSEALDREEAYKLERCDPHFDCGVKCYYGDNVYKINGKPYSRYSYITKCFDNGDLAISEDTFWISGIAFKWYYIYPIMSDSFTDVYDELYARYSEESFTLNSNAFGKIVLDDSSDRDFIILLQILSLSGVFEQ